MEKMPPPLPTPGGDDQNFSNKYYRFLYYDYTYIVSFHKKFQVFIWFIRPCASMTEKAIFFKKKNFIHMIIKKKKIIYLAHFSIKNCLVLLQQSLLNLPLAL